MSGYVDCACRDCFEIAIGKRGKALCHDCEKAGCEPNNGECCAEHTYGGSEQAHEERDTLYAFTEEN